MRRARKFGNITIPGRVPIPMHRAPRMLVRTKVAEDRDNQGTIMDTDRGNRG
jgi:hypothetical protein